METRIMYIECKSGPDAGSARIGRVSFNRTGRTLRYRTQTFRRIVGGGAKSNYIEDGTGAEYWISGPKRRGGDRLLGSRGPIEIDEDVRTEYWRDIRETPEHATQYA
jgi:hypothetical protein